MIIQMVPAMATDSLLRSWHLCWTPLTQLVLSSSFMWVEVSRWMLSWWKSYFDTVPMSLDNPQKLDGAEHFRRFWQVFFTYSCDCCASSLGLHGTFRDYILSSFLLREKKNTLLLPLVSKPSLTMQKNMKHHFSAGAILIALPICLFFFLCFRTSKWWRQRDNIPLHPFSFGLVTINYPCNKRICLLDLK